MLKLQILGTGCPSCRKLTETAETAVRELGIPYELEKVTDIVKILSFGVSRTPALAIGGQVMTAGKIPSVTELKEMFAALPLAG